MNLYVKPGSKVIYNHPDAGYLVQQKDVAQYLTVNEIYHVVDVEIGQSSSGVILEEFPHHKFNTVMFRSVAEDGTIYNDAEDEYFVDDYIEI